MSNFIQPTDFEKINLTLTEQLNNLFEKETQDQFPQELEGDLNLLCQKIISFQQEEKLQTRNLLEDEIDSFKEQLLRKYQEVLDTNKQEELLNLVCSMRILACIMAGLYLIKNNQFGKTLESVKNLYNGIDLIVAPIENRHDTVPIEIQIQLLELLKKLNLDSINRPSFIDNKDNRDFINYTTAIKRATRSGINSIEGNVNKIKEIEQNKRQKLALKQLKERVDKRKKEGIKETPQAKEFEKTFYEIMDSFRPEGWKLYQEN